MNQVSDKEKIKKNNKENL